jgi:hypothetical protein
MSFVLRGFFVCGVLECTPQRKPLSAIACRSIRSERFELVLTAEGLMAEGRRSRRACAVLLIEKIPHL